MEHGKTYRYLVVDVFADRPLEGNPLAVFPDASSLDAVTMQKIAKELNLSETVFIVPSDRADCEIGARIFTPEKEMLFAGHPTIGASFVILAEGIIPYDSAHFTLAEKVGPVPIHVDSGERPLIWLRTPPISEGNYFAPEHCAEALGLDRKDLLDVAPQFLSAGNPTIFVALRDRDAVDRARLDLNGLLVLKGDHKEPLCVFVFTPAPNGAYSRMFAPEYGIAEDPATGSSTGPLAAYMMRYGLVSALDGTRFTSEQGTKMGRRSILHVHIAGERGQDGIYVGGYVAPVAEAVMRI
jgi:trans-2,3-dihydro-3-hydroxyanthranilate isomerase